MRKRRAVKKRASNRNRNVTNQLLAPGLKNAIEAQYNIQIGPKENEQKIKHSREEVAYGFGHCESFLQTLAERSGIPFKSLASEVGKLLQYGQSR